MPQETTPCITFRTHQEGHSSTSLYELYRDSISLTISFTIHQESGMEQTEFIAVYTVPTRIYRNRIYVEVERRSYVIPSQFTINPGLRDTVKRGIRRLLLDAIADVRWHCHRIESTNVVERTVNLRRIENEDEHRRRMLDEIYRESSRMFRRGNQV